MFSPFSDDVYRLFFFVLSPSGDLRAGVAFVKFTTGLLPKWMDWRTISVFRLACAWPFELQEVLTSVMSWEMDVDWNVKFLCIELFFFFSLSASWYWRQRCSRVVPDWFRCKLSILLPRSIFSVSLKRLSITYWHRTPRIASNCLQMDRPVLAIWIGYTFYCTIWTKYFELWQILQA